MTADQAVAFLQALRAQNIYVKPNGWVVASCVLAKWTHQHHYDSKPSFGMKITDGQRASFHCFACRSGSAEELLHTMEMYVAPEFWGQYDFKTAHQILTDEAINIAPLEEYQEFKNQSQVFSEWPAYYLDSFKPAQMFVAAMGYLKKRNVSMETIEKHDLRFDSSKDMIVCPYWNVFGKLAGARGRSIHEDVSGQDKHFDYRCQGINNARLVWYNETVLNLPGPVVMVEGQFDCWRTELGWPKTVANLTAKPTLEKMMRLADAGVVVHIPDPDDTGEESKKVVQAFCNQLQIDYRWVDLPKTEEKLDPDKCHPEYLRECIEKALEK